MDIFSLIHQPEALAPRTSPSQGRILLIDDDTLHRSCLKEFLEWRGYQCEEAANGVEGLNVLRQQSIAMIITDNNMPEMDGLTFIEHVKQDFPNEVFPIFLMTAEVSKLIRFHAYKHGVCRVFEKPLNFQELCHAIDWVQKFDLSPSSHSRISVN